MINRLFFIVLLLSCIPLLHGLDIADHGKSCIRIVVNHNAERLEKMAAQDLQYFLEKVTKAKFRIVSENNAGNPELNSIYLGNTAFAARHGFPQSALKDEEWVIKTMGNNLIITGAYPIGTFYGVWAFLNKIGVYALTPDQEVVPVRKKLSVANFNIRQQPVFAGRMLFTDVPVDQMRAGISREMQHKLNMFTLRSGINHQETPLLTPYYIGSYYQSPKRLKKLLAHTLGQYVNPGKYFKTHPEYFAMNEKGKRFAPPFPYIREGSVCMSNKEVWKVTLDNLREMIKEDRTGKKAGEYPWRYPLSILDNMPYICKCPECKKISEEEGSEAGLLLRYINFVATQIRKEYPDVKIFTTAYSATRKKPKITRPVENVIIETADEFPQADAFRPLTHPINAHRLASLKSWADISHAFAVWDYWNLGRRYFNPPRIEVVLDAIKPDFELFRKLKTVGIFIEYERDFVTPQPFFDLHVFIGTQLMMDLSGDVEKLTDIFLKHYYGAKAAPVMRAYLDEIRQGVKTHPSRQTVLSCGRWHFLSPRFAAKHYVNLKKAAQMYQEGSPYRDRINEELIPLIWVSLLSRQEFAAEFQKAGVNISDLVPECRVLVDRYIRRWGGTKLDFIYKRFHERFESIASPLPRPAKFKDVPDENIRIFGTSVCGPYSHMRASVVKDPDSIAGKAMRVQGQTEDFHKSAPIRLRPTISISPRKYVLGNSAGKKDNISLFLKDEDIPKDEKYHWYKIPGKLNISEITWFWGMCWGVQFNLSSAWILADGVADNNVWECWFSAKFTGPAYSPGSKQENAVYVDMVVLTRPGTKEIK